MSLVLMRHLEGVQYITLNHENPNNPFSRNLEKAVIAAVTDASRDNTVKAIVVGGGDNRSFSAGGDFNEVKNLSTPEAIDEWIDRVMELYISVLQINKPTIAAVDRYAIGMGFQYSMMFDYRLGTEATKYVMPELRHGIGCTVGSAILGFTHGYNAMREIIFKCEEINPKDALRLGIINEIVPQAELQKSAVAKALEFASYPQTAFQRTKEAMNKKFISVLNAAREDSKQVHRLAFAARDAQKHFSKVLGSKY
jgi:carboxymethylproline synthase